MNFSIFRNMSEIIFFCYNNLCFLLFLLSWFEIICLKTNKSVWGHLYNFWEVCCCLTPTISACWRLSWTSVSFLFFLEILQKILKNKIKYSVNKDCVKKNYFQIITKIAKKLWELLERKRKVQDRITQNKNILFWVSKLIKFLLEISLQEKCNKTAIISV